MQALLSVNIALALAALAVGGHWVEWHFREAADVESRVSAFTLAAQVHAATAIAAFAAALSPTSLRWPIIMGLVGTLAFSGALYGFATVGWKAGMPGTVIGTILIALSWLWIALRLARRA
ncbi:MAG: DUF423 domain-containing protein [Pseudomonadota bacterium]